MARRDDYDDQGYEEHDEHGEVRETSIVRQGFGTRELARQNETAAIATAKHAEAMVQARFIMAMQRPRNVDDVRTKLQKRCMSPDFAAVARYRREVGSKMVDGRWEKQYAEGPSIRFVEAAIQAMGHMDASTKTIFDDATKRILLCQVIDFETGASFSNEITVDKTVERSSLREGQEALAKRTNSYGKPVYVVEANADQLATKQAALVSKTLRTLGQRLIPGEIVDDCMRTVLATQRGEITRDPAAARKKLVDGFDRLGVSAAMLVEYMGGQSLDGLTEDQHLDLIALGVAMKDNDIRWPEAFEASPYRASTGETDEKTASRTAGVRERLQAKKGAIKQQKDAAKAAAQKPAEQKPAEPAKAPGEDPRSHGWEREPGSDG